MKPVIKRSLVITLRIVSIAAVALLITLLALPLTDRGTAMLLDAISSLTPLTLEHDSGSLAGELRLRELALNTGGIALVIEDALLELELSCLLRSRLCFRQLQLGSLALAVAGRTEEEGSLPAPADSSGDPGGMLELPVAVTAESVKVGETRIQWPGGGWQQASLAASVSIEGSRFLVSGARVVDARLHQANSADSEPPPGNVIELPRIHLPLELVIEGLELLDPGWSMFAMEQQYDAIGLDGSWKGTELSVQLLSVFARDWGRLALSGELEFDQQWPLKVGLGLTTAQPAALPKRFHQRELSLKAGGSLADLQLHGTMHGSPSLELQGLANVLDRNLPFDMVALLEMAESLPVGELVELPESLAGVALDSPLRLQASGSIARQFLQLEAAATGLGYESLRLLAEASYENNLLILQSMELLDGAGDNTLSAAGQVQFGETLLAEIALESTGINLPDLGNQLTGRLQGKLRLEARSSAEYWAISVADIDLDGEINAMPASATGAASLNSELRLAGSDLSVDMNGAWLRLLAQQPDKAGRLELRVDDIGRWQPNSTGRLLLNAKLAPGLGDLTFKGSVAALRWQEQYIEQGTLEGAIQLEGEHAFSLATRLQNLRLGGVSLSALSVDGSGTGVDHRFSLVSEGDFAGQLAVTGSLQGADWQGLLQPTEWQTPVGYWQLAQKVPLVWSGESSQLNVGAHCWRDSQSELCPEQLLLGVQGRATVTGKGRLKRLAALLPQGLILSGAMQGSADAQWAGDSALTLKAKATAGPIGIDLDFDDDHSAAVRWDQLQVDLSAKDGAWLISLEALPGAGQSLMLDAALAQGQSGEISGELEVNAVQLAALSPFLLELSDLQGTLNGRLALSGTLSRPLANGKLQLADGQMVLLGNPTVVENVQLEVAALGDRATIAGSAILGGGELQLAGQVQSQPEFNLELSVVGGRHNVAYPPSTELVLSEDIQLRVSGKSVAVTGELIVHEGKLQQERLPPGSVGISRDIIEVDLQGKPIAESSPVDTKLDVSLRIHDNFSIVGNGLDATVGGELQIQQRPGRPLQLFGNLNIIGGRLEAFKQNLRIKSGTIGFVGAPQNPELNVRAQREIITENITVGVSLLGTLENPKLEVYSDPVMSETEALSYLMRGRGLDSGAGADGTALALSMGTSLVNQTGVLSNLERIPGLSNIQLGAEGSADATAATVSGYIGERIFISYGIGLYEPINVLVARLYLQTRLWLEVVSRLENSADLYYSFDID